MATKTIDESTLMDIADAIRLKKSSVSHYTAAQMAPEILSLNSEDYVVPLNFTALQDNSSVWFETFVGSDTSLQVSYDGASWSEWAMSSQTVFAPITLDSGETLYVRGDNMSMQNEELDACFHMSGRIAGGGSVMSLVGGSASDSSITEPFCFAGLFQDCTGLVTPPELPATTLSEGCYDHMFYGCTSLERCPSLPAKYVAIGCYNSMFAGCTGIHTASNLPATILASQCYYAMFDGCTALLKAPGLPSTVLAPQCYRSMFSGCTSLVTAPELPAETLAARCYERMFHGCSSLNYIKIGATSWNTANSDDWVANVAPSGTFVKPSSTSMGVSVDEIPLGWVPVDDTKILKFTETEGESVYISMTVPTSLNISLEISYDCINWNTWGKRFANEFEEIELGAYESVYIRGGNSVMSTSAANSQFIIDGGHAAASGSVMSLVDPTAALASLAGKPYCFSKLFYECENLTQAPELPATTLSMGCYYQMFYGCTALEEAPELPAETMAEACYSAMFYGCTALEEAPELPAETLAPQCYLSMFSGCESLTEAPELPATTMEYYSYGYMFKGCTGIERAPDLMATALVQNCYYQMFNGCSSLNYIKAMATSWNTNYAQDWVDGVAASGTFVKYSSATIPVGNSGIPTGWVTEERGMPLKFTAVGQTSTVSLQTPTSLNITLQRSSDCINWSTWTKSNGVFSTVTLSSGSSLYVRGTNTAMATSDQVYSHFTVTGSVRVSGTVMSLLDPTCELSSLYGKDYCFSQLFSGCSNIVSAPELPATTLSYGCYYLMFSNCVNLTTPPELPAHELEDECYSCMFINCTRLTTPPALPATTLATMCYDSMFSGCSSLATAPALPAATLESECYTSMFNSCTSLTVAPALQATTLTLQCYAAMFYGCTGLTSAPALPATALANGCYNSMFRGCIHLASAPALPAATLTPQCYQNMFYGCTGLTTAPALPAATLATQCYNGMFQNCSSLNHIQVGATSWNISNTSNWVYGVAASGTFVAPVSGVVPTGVNGIPNGWTSVYGDSALKFTAVGQTSTVTLHTPTSLNITLQKSSDCINWSSWTKDANGVFETITLSDGESVYLRGNNAYFASSPSVFSRFVLTGSVAASGNIMSILDTAGNLVSLTGKDYCFYALFNYCTSLTTPPVLPAETLANYCYHSMFAYCSNLTIAPALPAETLANYCYGSMFRGCTSLTASPVLPAETLASNCYAGMFHSCSNLTTAQALPAETLTNGCYNSMFAYCTNLTIAPALPAETLANGCYVMMFYGCTSLTIAPALPATTLTPQCYQNMFYGCTSLTTAPALPTTTLSDSCYRSMFRGCTSLTAAPELPAPRLTLRCYQEMFYNCSSLNYVKTYMTYMPSGTPNCLTDWLSNVSATGDFYCDSSMSLPSGNSGIPSGWTRHNLS